MKSFRIFFFPIIELYIYIYIKYEQDYIMFFFFLINCELIDIHNEEEITSLCYLLAIQLTLSKNSIVCTE